MHQKNQFLLGAFGALFAVFSHCADVTATPSDRRMPTIETQTLNGRKITLPRELPGEKTLVLMAFTRGQQVNVNTWIDGMKLSESPYAWVETPVVGKRNGLSKVFIDNGMRSGIRDVATREKTITLYTDRVALLKAMGLKESIKGIFAVVLDRQGNVLASVEGDYSSAKASTLVDALK
jgi:hypothetical protein